ncbi:AsnC family transcriptional regulator [Mesorhizobium loti]|uniref:AsnC family transcriptional regulator n=1 Tax=Rhizobium loti TaxID=381 RepID=A0A117N408_RHILI|nr:AsnC family transcriptional regulator [Mesorhizobium loti]
MKLDAIDLRILDAIQRDGRITKLALAEKVGLSATPCWTRLRRLEQTGVIVGYHARVALRRIMPITAVMVQVSLRNHRQSEFERFERVVWQVPQIVACWSLGGGVDYLLKVVASDIEAYQRVIDGLLAREVGIDRYFTYVVTRTVKEEMAFPLSALVGDAAG